MPLKAIYKVWFHAVVDEPLPLMLSCTHDFDQGKNGKEREALISLSSISFFVLMMLHHHHQNIASPWLVFTQMPLPLIVEVPQLKF